MKLLTHLYIANLIIDEIEGKGQSKAESTMRIAPVAGVYKSGMLRERLPGHNASGSPLVFPFTDFTFTVPFDVKKAILAHREYFRAGAAGCDTVPDMLFSQLIIHPADSGIWLEYMYDRMLMLPQGAERDQAYAFILGWMTHYAADMFGHAYVNEYAGGWFPSILSTIAHRHIAVESYMDRQITLEAMPMEKRKVSVPVDFIVSCFSDIKGIEERLNKIKTRTYTPAVCGTAGVIGGNKRFEECSSTYRYFQIIRYLSLIRDAVRGIIQYDVGSETAAHRALQDTVERLSIVSVWADNIDLAIKEWVAAWEKILQALLNGKGVLWIVKYLDEWAEDNISRVIYPIGISNLPGFVKDIAETITNLIKTVKGLPEKFVLWLFGAESKLDLLPKMFPDHYDRLQRAYTDDLTNEIVTSLFSGMYNTAADLYADLRKDFKEFGRTSEYPYGIPDREFRAFSYSLSASKLCVAGCDNLNGYLSDHVFEKFRTVPSVRRLRLEIKTVKATFRGKWDPGTYDPVRFDVYTNASGNIRTLIGCRFVSDSSEERYVVLPRPIPLSDIRGYGLSKMGAMDDWSVEHIKVFDADTKTLLASRYNFILADANAHADIAPAPNVSLPGTEVLSVPDDIMSWMYSLDGADLTGNNPAVCKPWEYTEYPIFKIAKLTAEKLPDEFDKYFASNEIMDIDYSPPESEKKRLSVDDNGGTMDKTMNA